VQEAVTAVTDGTDTTATVAEPDLDVSWMETAVIVAVPAPLGVNTPELFMLPMLDGLTDQVTAWLGLPVPVTVAVHADV